MRRTWGGLARVMTRALGLALALMPMGPAPAGLLLTAGAAGSAEGADEQPAGSAADPVPDLGMVQFSDGRTASGDLEFAGTLTLHDGATLRAIPTSQVASIELRAEEEGLVQGWRFIQPGQPAKEPVGLPYPVRHLVATITTLGGERLTGHLTTTVAWLQAPGQDDRERVVIPAKQEGGPGQGLSDLVYPVRLVPAGAATTAAAPARLRWQDGSRHGPGLIVIERPELARLAAGGGADGTWTLPAPVAPPAVVACPAADGWHVAWPPPAGDPAAAADEATTRALVAGAVAEAQDFLDHRQLLAVAAAGEDQLYALLLLMRVGPTTMAGGKPWRLEVWRWKREGSHLLWAARAYIARGLAANVEALPGVHLETGWWLQRTADGMLVIGEPVHGR